VKPAVNQTGLVPHRSRRGRCREMPLRPENRYKTFWRLFAALCAVLSEPDCPGGRQRPMKRGRVHIQAGKLAKPEIKNGGLKCFQYMKSEIRLTPGSRVFHARVR
jgi:hypothetical protein